MSSEDFVMSVFLVLWAYLQMHLNQEISHRNLQCRCQRASMKHTHTTVLKLTFFIFFPLVCWVHKRCSPHSYPVVKPHYLLQKEIDHSLISHWTIWELWLTTDCVYYCSLQWLRRLLVLQVPPSEPVHPPASSVYQTPPTGATGILLYDADYFCVSLTSNGSRRVPRKVDWNFHLSISYFWQVWRVDYHT